MPAKAVLAKALTKKAVRMLTVVVVVVDRD